MSEEKVFEIIKKKGVNIGEFQINLMVDEVTDDELTYEEYLDNLNEPDLEVRKMSRELLTRDEFNLVKDYLLK